VTRTSLNQRVAQYLYYVYGTVVSLTPIISKDIAAKAQSNRQLIERLVMKAQTIGPGQSHGSSIVADTRAMNQKVEGNFKISVSVEDEKYEFTVSCSLYVNKNKVAEIAGQETDEY